MLYDIQYGPGAKAGLPPSVAIKIHAESPEQRKASVSLQLYDKEMFFYTKLRDSVPVETPRPLAAWTDGGDGTDAARPVEFFALMMQDMTVQDGVEHEVHDISGLDPPRMMDADDVRALGKLQARLHDHFWGVPELEAYPLSAVPGEMSLATFAAGLPTLRQAWDTCKGGLAAKVSPPGHAPAPAAFVTVRRQ